MNQKSLFKFSKEDRDAFVGAITSTVFKEATEAITKAADADTGTFRVIVSTEDRDRQGEIVSMDGWDLSFYKMNPVVLWCHDYWGAPIATCTNIAVETIDEKKCLVAEGKWAPTPDGQLYRKLYDGKFLNTTSVGFIPEEYDNDTRTITKQQMLEFSFVPIPANPFALSLSMAKNLGLDLSAIARKGMTYTLTKDVENADIKAEDGGDQLGDACSLDDGTPGVLAEDPKNPKGPLMCVPDESKSHKSDENDDGDDGDGAGDTAKNPAIDEKTKEMIKAMTCSLSDEHDRHTKVLRNAADKMEEQMGNLDDQQTDNKSAANTHQESIDEFRTKMAGEHEKHLQKTKGIVKEYSDALAKKLADDSADNDSKGLTKGDLEKFLKTVTEAIAIRKGGEGKDNANGVEPVINSEEELNADGTPKGTPKSRSNRAGGNEMDDFMFSRTILRDLQKSIEGGLTKFNERAKKISSKK